MMSFFFGTIPMPAFLIANIGTVPKKKSVDLIDFGAGEEEVLVVK